MGWNWAQMITWQSRSARASSVRGANAVLRRTGQIPIHGPREIGYLKLSTNRREVIVSDGEPIALTPLEGRMLDYLMANAGLVLTFEALIDHAVGDQRARTGICSAN